MSGKRVLITGVAGDLAALLAHELEEADEVDYLVGVDVREPTHEVARMEFVRADIRNPLVARVIGAADIDTVVHMSVLSAPGQAGRSGMKEQNVIGTMQLLAACQKADALRKVVLKSTTAVYGSGFADPALFREENTPRVPPKSGFAKDATEVEGYARAFGRRRKDVSLSVLRFANFVGPTMDSILTRYFSLPVSPTVLGYDPRLQLCHEEDAVVVLRTAVIDEKPGIFNVAGPGVVYLSQAIRMAGRVPLFIPAPFVNLAAAAIRRSRRVEFSPEQLAFLQFGRVGDITRLRTEFGYQPRWSTRAAFTDFVASRPRRGVIDPDLIRRAEHAISGALQRAT